MKCVKLEQLKLAVNGFKYTFCSCDKCIDDIIRRVNMQRVNVEWRGNGEKRIWR